MEQTMCLSKPAAVSKNSTTACAPPSKPHNGYKPVQKLVQISRSLEKLSFQPKQTTQPLDCNNRTNTTATFFGCGQTGHLCANCPHLKHNVRSAAIRADEIGVPEKEPPAEDLHPQDEEGEGKEQPENAPDETGAEATGEWDPETSQYHWDEEEEETDNCTLMYTVGLMQYKLC